ncbi:MAG TPA: ATP-binding protein, partial [Thermoanaerobaculia bacterium]|nr:ATP-binding protein [Thermoanaerobaculia bacterium]
MSDADTQPGVPMPSPSERARRLAEAICRGMIAIATDAVISVDAEHNILQFNEGAERIFGWRADEVLGRPLDLLLPERFRGVHGRHMGQFAASPVRARRMGERQAISGLRRDGEEFPADASISRAEVDGDIVLTVVLRDITDRRRAEEAQQLLAHAGALLAASLDYDTTVATVARLAVPALGDWCTVYAIGTDGGVRRIAMAHADATREAEFESLLRLPLDRNRPHPANTAMETGQPEHIPDIDERFIRTIAQDNAQLEAYRRLGLCSALAIPLIARGEVRGAIGFFSAKAGTYTADLIALAREIGLRAALAIDNARLYGEAQQAIGARDDILAVVSHDLGNPLSAIRIGTSLLLKRIPPEERELGGWQHLEGIRQSAEQMERLIRNLLEVKRIEAGHLALQFERHSPTGLIGEIVELLAPIAAGRDVALDTRLESPLPPVRADRERILQVFSNLVGNAIKFTDPGGSVTIAARALGPVVEFEVCDTGRGIEPEHVDQVFERFWQVHRSGREGIGLGLAIAKGIVT